MKSRPNMLALLTALALVLTANVRAQRMNPPYLSQFPSVERVKAEIKVSDPIESTARQYMAFIILRNLVIRLAGGRPFKGFTRDEDRLKNMYSEAGDREYNQWTSPKDKAKLDEFNKLYLEKLTTDEVLRRFFSPEFRVSYYRITRQPMPPTPSSQQPAQPRTSAGGSAEDYVAQGDKYRRETKDYEMAVRSYKKAIALDRSQAGAYVGLALAYQKQGQYQLEISAWKQYLSLSPNDAEMVRVVFLSLGIAHFELKQYGEALQALRSVLSLKPDVKTLASAHFWIGRTYQKMEQYEKAVPAFREALRLNPEDYEASARLGETYYSMEQYSDAVAALQQAIRLKPDEADLPDLLYNLGIYYLAMEKKQEALQVYRRLLTLDKQKAQELLAEINKMK